MSGRRRGVYADCNVHEYIVYFYAKLPRMRGSKAGGGEWVCGGMAGVCRVVWQYVGGSAAIWQPCHIPRCRAFTKDVKQMLTLFAAAAAF